MTGEKTAARADFAAVLLAAGGSSRFGRPKQLLDWRGQPLVRHLAEELSASGARPVLVVIGSEAEAVAQLLADLPLHLVENPHWRQGLATSLASAVSALDELAPDVNGLLVALADQPLVDGALLARLLDAAAAPERPLVASSYSGILGPPAVFPRRLFPELLDLAGDRGARAVLERHRTETLAIDFPDGACDLDSPADYERLLARASSSISR